MKKSPQHPTSHREAALIALLEQKDAKFKQEQLERQAAEDRAAAQFLKLAENNSILARTNSRLCQQIDRLRAENEKVSHLASGQQAVAKAKESSLISEISGLKALLKDSVAQRDSLHEQLRSKEEVVRYLEWRLVQVQKFIEEQGIGTPTYRGPLAAAFDAAAKTAAGQDPYHQALSGNSLFVFSDTGEPTSSAEDKRSASPSFRPHDACNDADCNKENINEDQRHTTATGAIHQASTVASPNNAVTMQPNATATPSSFAESNTQFSNFDYDAQRAENNNNITTPQNTDVYEHTTPLQPAHLTSDSEKIDDRNEDSDGGDFYHASSTPSMQLRSSSRTRKPVSYVLPSVNSKLRQGDPFTFGDPSSLPKKKAPRTRTKPRSRYIISFKKKSHSSDIATTSHHRVTTSFASDQEDDHGCDGDDEK